MNQEITQSAKTVEEAIASALEKLSCTRDEVDVEVLEENSGGFLGIGKSATVRVTLRPEEAPVIPRENEEIAENTVESSSENVFDNTDDSENDFESEDEPEDEDSDLEENTFEEDGEQLSEEERLQLASENIERFLNEVLNAFHLDGVNEVKVEVKDGKVLADIDGEDCGILIGRKGSTLRALQYISSLLANRSTRSRVRYTLDIGGYRAKRQSNVVSLARKTAERALSTGQAYELTPMSATDRRIVHESLQDFEGITTYSEGEEPHRYVVIDLAYDDDESYTDEEI